MLCLLGSSQHVYEFNKQVLSWLLFFYCDKKKKSDRSSCRKERFLVAHTFRGFSEHHRGREYVLEVGLNSGWTVGQEV